MSNRGAEFRKSDLQIHSPRDNGWIGARPEDGLGASPSPNQIAAAREKYCRAFIAKCLAEGLRASALTDHHEGIYCYPMIETKRKMLEEGAAVDLWIFPGMELTCRDSCQAVILFDADLPQALFEKVRMKFGLPTDVLPLSPKGIQVELLDRNIEDIQALLAEDNELENRFIVLPHVKPDGHKTVLRKGFQKRFKDMPYVGGYMDQCYPHDLKEGDRRILDGEIPAWSSEKRGVISTSDARHADFKLIGKHTTWVKLASPTAESLRQAMLAPDSRIRYTEPNLPSAVISSIEVRGSKYLRDGVYAFNDQMNSVIGGRGAGKSTLLEYVRFALGCSAIDSSSGEGRASERLHELLVTTLDATSGSVSLSILLNGAPVVVTREVAKMSVITVNASGTLSASSVEEVRRLIPTQQYRQGELSELAREDASSRLLQLVTGQAAAQIADAEAKLKRNAQALSESLAKAVRLSAAKHARAHALTQATLLKAQTENLQKQLTTGDQPASPAISEHDKFLQQQAAIEKAIEKLKVMRLELSLSLGEYIHELKAISGEQPLIGGIQKLAEAFTKLRTSTRDDTDPKGELVAIEEQLDSWCAAMLLSFEQAAAEWSNSLIKHEAEYDQQKKALAGKQSVIESIEALNAQFLTAGKQLALATTDENTLRDADKQLDDLRIERRCLQSDLRELVLKQSEKIEVGSSGLARGHLSSAPDFSEAASAIRKVLDLPNLRDSRIETLLNSITGSEDITAKWTELLDELISLLKWKEGAPVEKGLPPRTPILHAALEDGFMEKLRERINPERVTTALQAVLRPRVEIFQIRDGAEIEFRRASQGEQAATLLNILMNQSTGPLIIDQPEEDLDNRIINDIIRTIRTTKNERQLILATHNANIAVNGDSENVIEMVLGERKACGAIDEPEVREAITKTMEGGKDAFELRRRKYNF